jgi:hypothetical protein
MLYRWPVLHPYGEKAKVIMTNMDSRSEVTTPPEAMEPAPRLRSPLGGCQADNAPHRVSYKDALQGVKTFSQD